MSDMIFTGKRIDNDEQVQGCLVKSRKCTLIIPVDVLEDRSQTRYDTDNEVVVGLQVNAVEVYRGSVELCTGMSWDTERCTACRNNKKIADERF